MMLNGLDGSTTRFLKNSRHFPSRPHLPLPSNTAWFVDCHFLIASLRSFLLATLNESVGVTSAAPGGRSSPGGSLSSLNGRTLVASGVEGSAGATLDSLLGIANPNFFLRVVWPDDPLGVLSMTIRRGSARPCRGDDVQISIQVS